MGIKDRKIYKCAIIGCGWIGCGAGEDVLRVKPASHAEAFLMNPVINRVRPWRTISNGMNKKTELIALSDISEDGRKLANRLYPNVPFFKDSEKMIKEVKPDIVTIATDPKSHCSLIELAARYKTKMIICEKPLSHDLKEAKSTIAYTKKQGSILLVNHTRRFDPLIRKYRDYLNGGYVRDNFLGKIKCAVGYYDKGVFHGGTHIIDLFRFFLGEVKWVSAVENKLSPSLKNDINADVFLGFENAVAALQIFNSNDYALSEIHFFGDRGKLTLRRMGGLEIEVIGFGAAASSDFSAYRELDYAKPLVFEGGKRSMLSGLVDHAVACLEGREKPISSGEEALKDMEVIEAIKKSVKLRGVKIKI